MIKIRELIEIFMDIDLLNKKFNEILNKTEGIVIPEVIFDLPIHLKDKIKPIIELAMLCCHTIPVLIKKVKDLEEENKKLKKI